MSDEDKRDCSPLESGRFTRERCRVLEMVQGGPDWYKLVVESTEIAPRSSPGQFVHVCVRTQTQRRVMDPILRRPLSIAGVSENRNTLVLLFRRVGTGTAILSRAQPGDELDLLGPLGRGFDTDVEGAENPLIIGGGVGVAPLIFLASRLRAAGRRVRALIGYKNPAGSVGLRELIETGAETTVVYETGASAGNPAGPVEALEGALGGAGRAAVENGLATVRTGLVTEYLKEVAEKSEPGVLYACGPLPVMREASRLAVEMGVPCQVSLEQRMACGVGACLGCSWPKALPGEGSLYYRVCVDGPVFDHTEVRL